MKTWFPKGKQRIIPTYGKHEGVKPVGFLDYETGRVYVEEHGKYDAGVFQQFLKNVLSQYPNGKTVIILDNARIHHAKLLKGFLEENRNSVELVTLNHYKSPKRIMKKCIPNKIYLGSNINKDNAEKIREIISNRQYKCGKITGNCLL